MSYSLFWVNLSLPRGLSNCNALNIAASFLSLTLSYPLLLLNQIAIRIYSTARPNCMPRTWLLSQQPPSETSDPLFWFDPSSLFFQIGDCSATILVRTNKWLARQLNLYFLLSVDLIWVPSISRPFYSAKVNPFILTSNQGLLCSWELH